MLINCNIKLEKQYLKDFTPIGKLNYMKIINKLNKKMIILGLSIETHINSTIVYNFPKVIFCHAEHLKVKTLLIYIHIDASFFF